MARAANVLAIEALAEFRAKLCIFADRARQAVTEIEGEVTRTRSWIRDDRLAFWRQQLRQRAAQLSEARNALNRAHLSDFRESLYAEEMAVQRAKRAVSEAEQKARIVRRWATVFDGKAAPALAPVRKLGELLGNDMGNAIAELSQMHKSLQDYAEVSLPGPDTTTRPNAAATEQDQSSRGDAPLPLRADT